MPTVLRRLRTQRGYSLRDLASEVGVSHVTIRNIEQGAGCHPRTRVALERVMGVPFDVLRLPDTTNAVALSDDGAGANRTPATTPEAS